MTTVTYTHPSDDELYAKIGPPPPARPSANKYARECHKPRRPG